MTSAGVLARTCRSSPSRTVTTSTSRPPSPRRFRCSAASDSRQPPSRTWREHQSSSTRIATLPPCSTILAGSSPSLCASITRTRVVRAEARRQRRPARRHATSSRSRRRSASSSTDSVRRSSQRTVSRSPVSAIVLPSRIPRAQRSQTGPGSPSTASSPTLTTTTRNSINAVWSATTARTFSTSPRPRAKVSCASARPAITR